MPRRGWPRTRPTTQTTSSSPTATWRRGGGVRRSLLSPPSGVRDPRIPESLTRPWPCRSLNRPQSVNYTKGRALQLKGKVLALALDGDALLVATAAATAVRVNLRVRSTSSSSRTCSNTAHS